MKPQHSAQAHIAWAVVAFLAGLVLAAYSASIISSFHTTLVNAQTFHDAPACESGADVQSSACIATVTATVVNAYIQHGSKGSVYYYVTVAPPASSGSDVAETLDVSYSDYYQMGIGTEVPATMWHYVLVDVSSPSGGAYQTPDNPIGQIAPSTFALVVPGFAVGLLMSAVFIAAARRTPNDVLRDATRGVPQPPRPIPDGLLTSVIGWSGARAMLFYGIALLLEAWLLTGIAQSHPTAIEIAPWLMPLTVVIVAALVYALVYRQMVRDVTLGVVNEIPVKWDQVLYNKGRPYAAKITYVLNNGSTDQKTIRARWWRLIHIGTRIHAIAEPQTGKIWRILGMTNDRGEPVY